MKIILSYYKRIRLSFFQIILNLFLLPGVYAVSYENIPIEDATISVAASAGKSVVSIGTEERAKMPQFDWNDQGNPGNDELRKFFQKFFGQLPQREYKQYGLGSGIIIDDKGHILTNAHVVDDAEKITVTLPDGRRFKGKVKGKDDRSDLAIIKIEGTDLPAIKLGDSRNLKTGQWVVAIGNPFGFAITSHEPTVTVGVVSAVHRSLGIQPSGGEGQYTDLIQTDAAINPGNSGGPLVNLKGEVIGINAAIFSTSGGYQGIGFAIPINVAKRIMKSLIEGKKVLYGWLGVSAQNIDESLASQFGLTDLNGALVVNVTEGGPAEKCGIQPGDVIRKIDNQDVIDVNGLLKIVEDSEPGKKVEISLIREKKLINLEATLGSRPEHLKMMPSAGERETWRGLSVENLTPENMERYGIHKKTGVVITNIESGSLADEAGLTAGDVIIAINRNEIKNLDDYNKIISSIKGNALIQTPRGFFVIKGNEQ